MRTTLARGLVALSIGIGGGTLATVARAGCEREGVAGPWQGRGVLTRPGIPAEIAFTFRDEFTVTPESLTGHMRFTTLGGLMFPPEVSGPLSEEYVVSFTRGEAITFRSNWGAGNGFWGTERYEMKFHDLSGLIEVEERGEILDCDNMRVFGDFYYQGTYVGTMTADYTRP